MPCFDVPALPGRCAKQECMSKHGGGNAISNRPGMPAAGARDAAQHMAAGGGLQRHGGPLRLDGTALGARGSGLGPASSPCPVAAAKWTACAAVKCPQRRQQRQPLWWGLLRPPGAVEEREEPLAEVPPSWRAPMVTLHQLQPRLRVGVPPVLCTGAVHSPAVHTCRGWLPSPHWGRRPARCLAGTVALPRAAPPDPHLQRPAGTASAHPGHAGALLPQQSCCTLQLASEGICADRHASAESRVGQAASRAGAEELARTQGRVTAVRRS